jgi:hypothetical protein
VVRHLGAYAIVVGDAHTRSEPVDHNHAEPFAEERNSYQE